MKDHVILAIESSCDETAAAVVKNGRQVLSSVILSQVEEHKKYGGVVPEIASRCHIEGIHGVVQSALEQADITLEEISAIAVTYAPGLIGALLVGINYAKGLSYGANKPLVPVHHLRGHIASNYITTPELEPPFLCLVVSGGHSHIVRVEDYTRFEIVGKTRDDAAGEAFDKAARAMGFPYPGGIHIDKNARSGDNTAYKLPVPRLDTPYDFSFSGLKTAVINLLHNAKQKGEQVNIPDLCASFQYTVCTILTQKLFEAAQQFGYDTVVAAGGVCANSELRRQLEIAAKQTGKKLYIPSVSLCGDNAAMIGAQGYFEFLAGNTASLDLNGYATMPIDQTYVR